VQDAKVTVGILRHPSTDRPRNVGIELNPLSNKCTCHLAHFRRNRAR
jgi:hypothetical protein